MQLWQNIGYCLLCPSGQSAPEPVCRQAAAIEPQVISIQYPWVCILCNQQVGSSRVLFIIFYLFIFKNSYIFKLGDILFWGSFKFIVLVIIICIIDCIYLNSSMTCRYFISYLHFTGLSLRKGCWLPKLCQHPFHSSLISYVPPPVRCCCPGLTLGPAQ